MRPPFLIVCFLGFLYLRTLAPGLTWAFDSADGGDLLTAAVTGGVPHPTGYPTYLVIASTFLQLPLGSFAYRTNLLSLVAALLAAGFLYRLVLTAGGNRLAASVAALACGTAPLFWSQAIVTEVYALQALIMVGMLILLTAGQRRLTQWGLGVVCGLGIGNHISSVLMLPLLLLRPAEARPAQSAHAGRLRLYLHRFGGVCLGLLIYLVLPLRAGSAAPVNWLNAVTAPAFFSLVTGQMYWTRLGIGSVTELLSAFRSWAGVLVGQWGAAGVVLAALGLSVSFKPTPLHLSALWMASVVSLFSVFYRSPDSYVYLIPVVLAGSLWLGLGSQWLVARVAARSKLLAATLAVLITGLLIGRGLLAVPRMDLSADDRAEQFAAAILGSAPAGAIVISGGDESTFSLWYFHFAYDQRPDLAIVSSDLLAQAWYRDVLRSTYPELVLPLELSLPALSQANPGRPLCNVLSIVQARMACSPTALNAGSLGRE